MYIPCSEHSCQYCSDGTCHLYRAGSVGTKRHHCRCLYYIEKQITDC